MWRWLGGGLVAAVIGMPLLLVLSARCSLDDGFQHTARSRALPRLSSPPRDGLFLVPARGMEFRTRLAGADNAGPALLLLHGFPETSAMWEPLLEAGAAAGLRVAAFDQRGYSPGARPEEQDAYRVTELRRDALAVADALGFERFHLVGHDWGSIVAWSMAGAYAERLRSVTSLSIPHPAAGLRPGPDASPPLYVRVFRQPGVAETLLAAGGHALLHRTYGAVTPAAQVDGYVSVFSEPGALAAALAWYRAQPESFADPETFEDTVSLPALWVWGKDDMEIFHSAGIRARMEEITTGPYRALELDAGHWLIQEATGPVIEAILAHVAAHP